VHSCAEGTRVQVQCLTMKWKTHLLIGKHVFGYASIRYHIPASASTSFHEGLLRPDKIRAEAGGLDRSKHHLSDPRSLMPLVWKVRAKWANGNVDGTMFELGIVLHYVHDSIAGRGFRDPHHSKIENDLLDESVPVEVIESGVNAAISSPKHVRYVLAQISPKDNPKEIMRNAAWFSGIITGAILDTRVPMRLEEEYSKARREHEGNKSRRQRRAVGFILLASLVGGGVTITWPSVWPVIFLSVLVSSFIVLAWTALSSDPKYEELKEERAWWLGIQAPRTLRALMQVEQSRGPQAP
jgi:hypothetical protein